MIKKLKFKSMYLAHSWVNSVRYDYKDYGFKSVLDKYKFGDITQLVYDLPEMILEVEIDSRGYGVAINGYSIGSDMCEFLLHDHEIINCMIEVESYEEEQFFMELAVLVDKYNMEPKCQLLNDMFSKKDLTK